MADHKSAQLLLLGWPILLTAEMSAQFLSLDKDSFEQLTARHKVAPVDIGDGTLKWHRTDLERAVRRLPTAPQDAARAPRQLALDQATIRNIVDQLAPHLASASSRSLPDLVSIKAAITALGIGRSKIYRLINDGELEVKHIGRRTLIPRAEIDRILQAGIP